jgi:dipeptidase D
MDMISFGPNIRGAHTPEEKVEIASVELFYSLLVDLLKEL